MSGAGKNTGLFSSSGLDWDDGDDLGLADGGGVGRSEVWLLFAAPIGEHAGALFVDCC